jgi:uncharacterized SAM-binding protein YcdF (DUF218 family)
MFFALSKILAFLISPINYILVALIIGVFAKSRKRKRRSFIAAAVLFLVFSNGFISNKSMSLIEMESVGRSDLPGTYAAGILLGGMIHYQSDSNLVNFNANGDRLFQTIDLYMSGKIDRIIISSGSGLMQLPSFRESYLIKKYLVGIGLPAGDILVETRSRNTYENAVETGLLLDELYGSRSAHQFLLITSASHMRRAVGCFRKQGIDVIPYSTTKRAVKGKQIFDIEMILPNPAALWQWKTVNHEIAGIVVYRLTGKL